MAFCVYYLISYYKPQANNSKLLVFMSEAEKEFYEKLSEKELSGKEVYEAKSNFVGFFDLLYRIDRKLNERKSSAGSTKKQLADYFFKSKK